jgi:small subunit ribosomal protein S18
MTNGAKPKMMKRRKKKVCVFCADKITLDIKDVGLVKRFISDRGKILPRRNTGCCALHQRWVAQVVKAARNIGLVPYTVD